MSQSSGFWNTSASPSGHQVAGYTQVHWSTAMQILAACNGFEGAAPSYLNLLAGTVTGANTVQIDSGGALVDGKWYNNDAAVSVNIPSASGAGNTRIDRIVLRATWGSFETVITRIAGTDAATPSAPAITQTSGTTYDIMLYQALVDTAGTVTLTDERNWSMLALSSGNMIVGSAAGKARGYAITGDVTISNTGVTSIAAGAVGTTELANDAVTQAKIGAGAVGTTEIAAGAVGAAQLAAAAAWTGVTFENSWSSIPDVAPVSYYKDLLGIVHLRGVAGHSTASADPIFTLPAGYRPEYDMDIVSTTYDQGGGVYNSNLILISDAGVVKLNVAYPTAPLDGITFRAA
ncbi:MAG: hypothetical protein M1281_04735 [Chloroflexi bacterium]|nr:hypothetical protein [Chloroflexota bacterium]